MEQKTEPTEKQDAGEPSNGDGCSFDPRGQYETLRPSPLSPSLPSLPTAKIKRRAKVVSFTEEVLSKDHAGDGNNVVVKEEQGVFLGPFLGRVTVSSSDNGDNQNHDRNHDRTPGAGSAALHFGTTSHAPHAPPSSRDSGGEHCGGKGSNRVKFDNLVVRMGLLKCGHRYRLVIPVPSSSWWNPPGERSNVATENSGPGDCRDTSERRSKFSARIIEHSLDGDLRGEVEMETHDGCATVASSEQCFLKITLSASRRGPYRGRFAVELLSCNSDADSPTQRQHRMASGSEDDGDDDHDDHDDHDDDHATTEDETPPKCIMSIQVDATIMGKDMGTPKLRNGVVCLGKMVGYDSDDDTEWQGFD